MLSMLASKQIQYLSKLRLINESWTGKSGSERCRSGHTWMKRVKWASFRHVRLTTTQTAVVPSCWLGKEKFNRNPDRSTHFGTVSHSNAQLQKVPSTFQKGRLRRGHVDVPLLCMTGQKLKQKQAALILPRPLFNFRKLPIILLVFALFKLLLHPSVHNS